MSTKIEIKFNTAGFVECLQGLEGTVQAEAEGIASRAGAMLTGQGTGFHVEMTQMARYQDSAYGATRPVAYVCSNDEETAKEEAENKILSKAVSK